MKKRNGGDLPDGLRVAPPVVDLRSTTPGRISSSTRLRIAEIAPVWLPVPPPGYGGAERVVGVLTDELVERGHEVTLFAVGGSRTRATLVCTMEDPPHPDDETAVLDDVFHSLTAYLRAGEFDVIHDHSRLGPALGAVLRDGPPVVHTLHGQWTAKGSRLLGALDRRVGLVAISHAQMAADPTLRYAGVVHNGIDVAAHPYRDEKDDFLVFVGRINPEKGPAAALEIARRTGRPLKMAIKRREKVEWDYWNEVVAPLLRPEDEVFEQPPEALKLDLLARARATLFPIDWPEPFGLVMAESMACGTPVIARRLGAAPEVVEHGVTGFVCDTIEEMAAAVESVGSLSASTCRERAEQRFSGPAMAAAYEQVFDAACARSNAPALPGEATGR
ncbi:MAG: glycosyltransferase family 4 protein [Acidimicrobiales bacterium]